MMKLSTGQDSTLGNYEKLTRAFFGEGSKPHQLITKKIANSPNGESEEVIQHETQMLQLFGQMITTDTN